MQGKCTRHVRAAIFLTLACGWAGSPASGALVEELAVAATPVGFTAESEDTPTDQTVSKDAAGARDDLGSRDVEIGPAPQITPLPEPSAGLVLCAAGMIATLRRRRNRAPLP